MPLATVTLPEELPTWPKSKPAPLLQFVVAIRDWGADDVSEVIGPFPTLADANAWVSDATDRVDETHDQSGRRWYDVLSLNPPTF